MPLFKQWQDKNTTISIWKIEEEENFFLKKAGLKSDKKFLHRRLEHLASRYLLVQFLPDLVLDQIIISDSGKPHAPGHPAYFSISHSFPYAAVAISHDQETGIDIQVYQDKILRLQHKFLSDKEQLLFENDPQKITLAWTAKEAAFKWYALGGVDFIRHMPINDLKLTGKMADLKMKFSKEHHDRELVLKGGMEDDFAWAYL